MMLYILAFIGVLAILRALWHVYVFQFKIHHDPWHQDRYYRPRSERFNWNPFNPFKGKK